jgi:hypothetical protein
MNFEVKRNLQFTKLIKAEGRLREFNFTRLTGLMEGIFSLDVVDDRGNRIIFQMKNSPDGWQLSEAGLPEWITANTPHLQQFIEEELSEDNRIQQIRLSAAQPSE